MGRSFRLKGLVQAGLIAAMYVVLSLLSSLFGLTYGAIQFRLSEVLNVLALFTPDAIPGLTIGCFLMNIGSPLGWADMVFGTLATLLSAGLTYGFRHCTTNLYRRSKDSGVRVAQSLPLFPLIWPVLMNGIICSLEIALLMNPEGAFWPVFWSSFASIGFSEAVLVYVLGLPLSLYLKNHIKYHGGK